ncbi:hypothetical protein A6770_28480 [Nostoc minutum NIES-26]|uniref:Uncharacterized protein n=1 Tax=Nostoc minutum NIES-26 TaxID=1844469 RepID=A0A367QJC2_9NOSO|nr:hypothetical protein A6770_28480 [Nostoc minutum NIES-26]
MPTETDNNSIAKSQQTNVKPKRRQRQLSAPPSSTGDGRKVVNVNVSVAPNTQSVLSMPLYSVFATSPLADELFMKVSKSVCISLTSKQSYNTNINGYLCQL